MSKPDLSTILDNATSHASSNAHLPSLADLVPQTQGVPSSLAGAADQLPNSHAQADAHAGGGIIGQAAAHTDVTLPDLVSLTGHDWFIHS
jgi:hypothetical protein